MNKLPLAKRAQILGMMVEGISIRAISRMTGASKNTIVKLLADAGQVCSEYQNCSLVNLPSKRLQADEIWSFVYHASSIYFMYYNFVRIHQTLRCSPAMEAKVTERLWSLEDMVALVDEWEASQKAEADTDDR